MIEGPDTIYKCPECGTAVSCGSYVSGNTFGAIYYSDGRMIAPMLPEYPVITSCHKCLHIFWLNEAEEESIEEEFPFNYSLSSMLKRPRRAKFLAHWQYGALLEQKRYKTRKEERYLRIRYWWSVNDEIRDKKISNNNYYEKMKCIDNLKDLILILTDDIIELAKADINDYNADEIDNDTLMIAELHRNLGNFDECRRTLKEIFKPELNYLMQLFENECEKKNKLVFRVERKEL